MLKCIPKENIYFLHHSTKIDTAFFPKVKHITVHESAVFAYIIIHTQNKHNFGETSTLYNQLVYKKSMRIHKIF